MEELFLKLKKRIEKEDNLVESLCLSNCGGVIWKAQYIPGSTSRNIYSHSKSFTSLMVGIAIDEGMITLDTRLVDALKDDIDNDTYNRLYEIKVKHLLMMSSGFDKPLLMGYERKRGVGYPDYLKYILSMDLVQKPGTKFCYSNGDTYLLGRIIAKVYNKPFTQLCYEKIFIPLEICLPMWGVDPQGYCMCATELCLNIEDMNKLGILFLNKGIYKGNRIVSEEYVNLCANTQIKTNEYDWGDYSFQFWMIPGDKGYRADGMYGQITYIFPKQGYAFSVQRPDDDNFNKYFNIFIEEVISRI